MVLNGYKYGISVLPVNCLAYKSGYRFGAYKSNLNDSNDVHIVDFFKTHDEIQQFVNKNAEYGKGGF